MRKIERKDLQCERQIERGNKEFLLSTTIWSVTFFRRKRIIGGIDGQQRNSDVFDLVVNADAFVVVVN